MIILFNIIFLSVILFRTFAINQKRFILSYRVNPVLSSESWLILLLLIIERDNCFFNQSGYWWVILCDFIIRLYSQFRLLHTFRSVSFSRCSRYLNLARRCLSLGFRRILETVLLGQSNYSIQVVEWIPPNVVAAIHVYNSIFHFVTLKAFYPLVLIISYKVSIYFHLQHYLFRRRTLVGELYSF